MVERYGVDNIFKDPSLIEENVKKSSARWADREYKDRTSKAISESRKGQYVVYCSCVVCKRQIQANNLSNHLKIHLPTEERPISHNKGKIHLRCSCVDCRQEFGVNNSSKHKCKIKETWECPHCESKSGQGVKRYNHFENCKRNPENILPKRAYRKKS